MFRALGLEGMGVGVQCQGFSGVTVEGRVKGLGWHRMWRAVV